MPNIAIVVSDFNENITSELLSGAITRLKELGVENPTVYHVPGAVEIPLIAKLLAKKNCYHAIITLGAVIRGDTSHYDYVCEQVSRGCQQVMLNFDIPVVFGVLTTDNEQQAMERIGGKHGHKGKEAAETAVNMCQLVDKISNPLSNPIGFL